jgi:hypothetical protein
VRATNNQVKLILNDKKQQKEGRQRGCTNRYTIAITCGYAAEDTGINWQCDVRVRKPTKREEERL